MRKTLLMVLAMTGVLLAAGVMVFHFAYPRLTILDAVYFVVTTLTTVGYGDIALKDAPAPVKIFGVFLMLAGAASMASLFGLITDSVMRVRLQEFLGKRRRTMKDHVVLCGMGNVGFRVLEHLRRLGRDVVVVEKQEDNKFLEDARRLGVQVVIGDIRLASTLERAGVKDARCVIAVSDNDLANLEAGLNARNVNEGIRVVLRVFDQNLANKIKKGFNIQTAFSTSTLAAPAFAMAALDPSVVGCFFVGDDLMLTLEVTVKAGGRLDGLTVAELTRLGRWSVLSRRDAASGEKTLYPDGAAALAAGDALTLAALPECVADIQALNNGR